MAARPSRRKRKEEEKRVLYYRPPRFQIREKESWRRSVASSLVISPLVLLHPGNIYAEEEKEEGLQPARTSGSVGMGFAMETEKSESQWRL